MKRRSWTLFLLVTALVILGGFIWLSGRSGHADSPYKMFKVFSEVLHLVQQRYVVEPDPDKIRVGALMGLTKRYGHNTSILYEEDLEYWRHHSPGQGVLGMILEDRGNFFAVRSVFPGESASEAGIERGDRIYEIDGKSTLQLNLVQAYHLLDGRPGTQVRIGLLHASTNRAEYLDLMRMESHPINIIQEYREADRIGILRIANPGHLGDRMVADQLRLWNVRGLNALILDLRNCGGDNYETIIRIADLFRDKGNSGMFLGADKRPLEEPFKFASETTLFRGPIGVIMDLSTAGDCEMLAGLLQKRDKTVLAGLRTRGEVFRYDTVKSNQTVFLWMPVAAYYAEGSKQPWSEKGIQPELKFPEETPGHPLIFVTGDEIIPVLVKRLKEHHKAA